MGVRHCADRYVAFVTGATSGLGRATRSLLRGGASVALRAAWRSRCRREKELLAELNVRRREPRGGLPHTRPAPRYV